MDWKILSWLADDTIFIAVLLVLIGSASFGLGRLSVGGEVIPASLTTSKVQLLASTTVLIPNVQASGTPIGNTNGADVITAKPPASVVTGPYVGSKSGKKYYLATCSGVKRIKEENKVFFATKNDAQASGYEPAVNCAM